MGHGDRTEESSIPQEVNGIKGKPTLVACGGSLTVVLTGELHGLRLIYLLNNIDLYKPDL